MRETRDYRRVRKHRPQEPGYVRLSVTLRPDHVQELEATGRVCVTTVLSDGHEAWVSTHRGLPVMNLHPERWGSDPVHCRDAGPWSAYVKGGGGPKDPDKNRAPIQG